MNLLLNHEFFLYFILPCELQRGSAMHWNMKMTRRMALMLLLTPILLLMILMANYLLSFQSQHITYFNISLIFTTKSEIIQSIHSSCSLLTVSITIFIVITNHCFRYTLSATYHNVSMTKLNWTTVEYQDMRPNYGWPGRLGHLLKLCNTGQSGNLSIRVHNFVRICHILSCLFI